MPFAQIFMIEGRTEAQKRAVIEKVTQALVEAVDGDFYTVVGFPVGRFVRALRRVGFSLPTAKPTAP